MPCSIGVPGTPVTIGSGDPGGGTLAGGPEEGMPVGGPDEATLVDGSEDETIVGGPEEGMGKETGTPGLPVALVSVTGDAASVGLAIGWQQSGGGFVADSRNAT
jgi:hypothetical protein